MMSRRRGFHITLMGLGLICLGLSVAWAGNLNPSAAPASTMATLDTINTNAEEAASNAATAALAASAAYSYGQANNALNNQIVPLATDARDNAAAAEVAADAARDAANAAVSAALSAEATAGVAASAAVVAQDPRTPISTPSSWPIEITSPGSHYLTENLTGGFSQNGIVISSDNVTLDLSGFTLTGQSGSGIVIESGVSRVVIRNGVVDSWPVDGVSGNANSSDCLFENLSVTNCATGIRAGQTTVVRNCTSSANTTFGIFTVEGCIISDCVARENETIGIAAGEGSLVVNCVARNNFDSLASAGVGIVANASHVVIRDCSATSNKLDGIRVGSDSVVQSCLAHSNGSPSHVGGDGAGIHATGTRNRIEGNTAFNNNSGIDIDSSDNLIIRNSAGSNTTSDFDVLIPGNNLLGTVQTIIPAATPSPWDNFQH